MVIRGLLRDWTWGRNGLGPGRYDAKIQNPEYGIWHVLKSGMRVTESFRILDVGEFMSFHIFTTLRNGYTQSNLIKQQRILVKGSVTHF